MTDDSPPTGQTFRLLTFKKPDDPIIRPSMGIIHVIEHLLEQARAGRFAAFGACAVTDEGALVQVCIHNVGTIAGLVTANRLLEATLVQECLTTYKADPDAVLPKVAPENTPPPAGPEEFPEKDEEE